MVRPRFFVADASSRGPGAVLAGALAVLTIVAATVAGASGGSASGLALPLGLARTDSAAAAVTGAAEDSLLQDDSDAAFLRRLQSRQLEGFPEELLAKDDVFADSVVALHDSLGLRGLEERGWKPRRRLRWNPSIGSSLTTFNRAEGFVLAAGLRVRWAGSSGPRLSLEGGRAFASDAWRHHTELRWPLRGRRGESRLEIEGGDQVVPFGSNRVFANGLRTFVGGSDEQDYLRRRGASARLRWALGRRHWLALRYGAERQSQVDVQTDFSLWGGAARAQPTIDEGIDRFVEFSIAQGVPRRQGLFFEGRHRIGGGGLGGDFSYQRTELRTRWRRYLGRFEVLTQLRAVHTGGRPPVQQRADIGGLGSLRAFDPRVRVGESALSARLELYWPDDLLRATRLPLLRSMGLQAVPWLDAARVMEGDDRGNLFSAGLGLQRFLGFFDQASYLRLDLAVPFGHDRTDDLRLYLGFNGAF